MATSKIQAKKTLLWTNPNPTASFPPQAVQVDLSIYKEIEVYGYLYTGFPHLIPIVKIPVGKQGNLTGVAGTAGETTGGLVAVTRGVSANLSAINFSEGMGCPAGGNWAINNGNAIPYQIYGIK